MLSPGSFHKFVPTDHDQNLQYRRWLLEACRDPVMRAQVKEACRQDIFFYVNSFVWQFNPDNLEHEVEPFICYDFQADAIREIFSCIEDQEDARWPKSRKMGASWVALIALDWLCMFHKNKMVGVMSRDADSVDQSGDPNSLFWKIDFMHKNLPNWLKGKITKHKMRYTFESTGSFIVGEANTSSAFVSGRATILMIDEFGKFKNGTETFELTSDVAHCRLFIFTHEHQNGMAYDLCFDPKYKGMREIKTHWSQHPVCNKGLYRYLEDVNQIEVLDKAFKFDPDFEYVYDVKPLGGPFPGLRSPWYDKQCRRRSERDVAMNLDIDPRGATDKFFDGYRLAILKRECSRPLWVGRLDYNKETGQPIELVADSAGKFKLWVNPRSPTAMPTMRTGGGVDVSAGSGATPSCLSIMNADTGEKILEYADALIYANEFAALCVAMCRLFKDRKGISTLLCWEVQGSQAFARRVMELGYAPYFVKRNEEILGRPRDEHGRPGVSVQPKEALARLEIYRDALYQRRCVNWSEFALEEAMKFIYTERGVEYRGSKKPKKGLENGSNATIHHGDIVTADVLAYKMIVELGFREPKPEETTADPDWIDPRTFAGRMRLAELEKEDELVWV